MSELFNKKKKLKRLKRRNIIINTVCILLVGYAIVWTGGYFWRSYRYVTTNDAVIDQYISPVNIRVSGYIKEVRFTEHQFVKTGDTLLVLDDREYLIKLKDAKAALMDAKSSKTVLGAGIEVSRANVSVQEANIAETEARLWQLEQDHRRYANLLEDESVTEQQYEQVKANYDAMKARLDAFLRQKNAAQSQYSETSNKTGNVDAAILRMEADLEMAELNLSYTVITAPYDGYMGRRSVEAGQLLQPGQTVSYLVRSEDKWVTANYKETQIAHIFIGQKVRIKVDALDDRIFYGRVTAISEATGSKYSLVPTDNSAGNFVKVQQRIPVRIDFEDVNAGEMKLLRTGMMVVTEAQKP